MNPAETLIEELMHNARTSGSKPLERRMADLSVWFYKNRSRISRDNLAARQEFLEKALWISLEIQALMLERIREMGDKSGLWLPKALLIDGEQNLPNGRFG